MLHVPCDLANRGPPEFFFIVFRMYHFLFVFFFSSFFIAVFSFFGAYFDCLSLCLLPLFIVPFANLVLLRFSFFSFFFLFSFSLLPFVNVLRNPLCIFICHFFLDLSFCKKKKFVFKRNMTYFLKLSLFFNQFSHVSSAVLFHFFIFLGKPSSKACHRYPADRHGNGWYTMGQTQPGWHAKASPTRRSLPMVPHMATRI